MHVYVVYILHIYICNTLYNYICMKVGLYEPTHINTDLYVPIHSHVFPQEILPKTQNCADLFPVCPLMFYQLKQRWLFS